MSVRPMPAAAVAFLFLFVGCSEPTKTEKGKHPDFVQPPREEPKGAGRAERPKAKAPSLDPVQLLKDLVAQVERKGTTERLIYMPDPLEGRQIGGAKTVFGWYKRRMTGSDFRFDVRKSDSLVNPIVGSVTWTATHYESLPSSDKAVAEKAQMRQIQSKSSWWAELGFQGGRWVLLDLGYISEAQVPGVGKVHSKEKYSSRKDEGDTVVDWWQVFHGR